MKTYSLTFPPVGGGYRRLLQVAGEFASIAGFVQGSPTREPRSLEFMAAAGNFLLREELVYEYPGGRGRLFETAGFV